VLDGGAFATEQAVRFLLRVGELVVPRRRGGGADLHRSHPDQLAGPLNHARHRTSGGCRAHLCLDRIGLGGDAFAAAFTITAGASLVLAVLLTLRLLTGEERARAAAPFVALAPGAVWVGVSADGYFAGVAA
jgi:hypothetical protein